MTPALASSSLKVVTTETVSKTASTAILRSATTSPLVNAGEDRLLF